MKAIILAAGEGKRMNSKLPKVLHEILEKTIIDYVIDSVQMADVKAVCMVLGHKKDEIQSSLAKYDLTFATQEKQLGTGHAVMMAGDFISEESSILVLNGDTPLIKPQTLKDLIRTHEANKNAITVVSANMEDPRGYGRIVNKNGKIVIVEEKDASEEEKKITEVNTGLMCLHGSALKKALTQLKADNAQKEYYLTDTLELIQNEGEKAEVFLAEDSGDFLGINTKVQLHEASRVMQKRINEKHMLQGVTIIDSQTTYISDSVKIGQDTVIYPNTFIKGETVIGENCNIGQNCNLDNMIIGDFVEIISSTALDSHIGKNSHIGPYAYIRPNSHLGENVKIGDFVEVKNSTIGDGTKASHLTYIGDAEVGKCVNFGCGTVTVNYDGRKKNKTYVKDNAFIGCNTNLIAPVTLEEYAYTGAGSTITDNVPSQALGIARATQDNKLGWVKNKKS